MANEKKTEAAPELSMQEVVKQTVKTVMEETLPIAVMAATQAALTAQKGPQRAAEKYAIGERCHLCGQYMRACKGEHVMMIVAPANPRRFKSFPAVGINSVWYKSPNMHTPIPVPKENNIAYAVMAWEEGEEDLHNGRLLEHDSGTLSPRPGQSNINQANPVGFKGFA